MTLWHTHYWASGALKKNADDGSPVLTTILLVTIVLAALASPRPEELRAIERVRRRFGMGQVSYERAPLTRRG